MWIISTFDPKFQKKTIGKNIERYWSENILHITKSKLFLWMKVLIPTMFLTIVLITLMTFVLITIKLERLIITLIIILLVWWTVPMLKILKLYLDYKMDFVVVNPRSLIRYNQEWFFKRISKTIDLKDIRSTSVRKSWFINSIFNNGELVILSESGWTGTGTWAGEIVFRFVYHPDLRNSEINKLLNNNEIIYKNSWDIQKEIIDEETNIYW